MQSTAFALYALAESDSFQMHPSAQEQPCVSAQEIYCIRQRCAEMSAREATCRDTQGTEQQKCCLGR